MKYTNSQIEKLINEHIHSERDRNIMIDRFVNGLTFSELSDKFYLSERQVKRIIKKADFVLILLQSDM